ncbi:MAG TPA: BlaI/MecI/CopY family transcriptional regulator [Gemmataceae bacterium]|nr:BlaI/MecI/CopY family transcriptional regulator [Gemmataceae bacterium]
MARVLQDVTDAELAVLQELWNQGSATVRQLMDVLYPEGGPSPFATVQKLLERLASKGYVARVRTGGVHVYRAVVGREQLAGNWLETMAEKLGEESLTPLLTHLVASQRLSTSELEDLRKVLDQMLRNAQRKNERD